MLLPILLQCDIVINQIIQFSIDFLTCNRKSVKPKTIGRYRNNHNILHECDDWKIPQKNMEIRVLSDFIASRVGQHYNVRALISRCFYFY
mgnify:CR=1 FL=1